MGLGQYLMYTFMFQTRRYAAHKIHYERDFFKYISKTNEVSCFLIFTRGITDVKLSIYLCYPRELVCNSNTATSHLGCCIIRGTVLVMMH